MCERETHTQTGYSLCRTHLSNVGPSFADDVLVEVLEDANLSLVVALQLKKKVMKKTRSVAPRNARLGPQRKATPAS